MLDEWPQQRGHRPPIGIRSFWLQGEQGLDERAVTTLTLAWSPEKIQGPRSSISGEARREDKTLFGPVNFHVKFGAQGGEELCRFSVTGHVTYDSNLRAATISTMTEQTEPSCQATGQNVPHNREPDSRRTRKPEEVGKILGIGRNQVYELIRNRDLRSISVGRKLLVPLTAIDEFLAGQV